MARDGDVAGLTGQRSTGVVPWPLAEVGRVGPLDHDLVDADHRDADVTDGVPLGRGGRGRSWDGRSGRQLVERRLLGEGAAHRVAVGLLLELRAQSGLCVGLLHRGAPDLVGREEEQQHAQPDEDPPDDVDDPS